MRSLLVLLLALHGMTAVRGVGKEESRTLPGTSKQAQAANTTNSAKATAPASSAAQVPPANSTAGLDALAAVAKWQAPTQAQREAAMKRWHISPEQAAALGLPRLAGAQLRGKHPA